MSQNNKKQKIDNNNINIKELKSEILKEMHTMFLVYLNEQFKIKLEEFIENKIETLLNEKFNKVFEKEFESKIVTFLENNFNLEDLAKLNESLERRLKELIEKNEDIKNRSVK